MLPNQMPKGIITPEEKMQWEESQNKLKASSPKYRYVPTGKPGEVQKVEIGINPRSKSTEPELKPIEPTFDVANTQNEMEDAAWVQSMKDKGLNDEQIQAERIKKNSKSIM